MRELGVCARYLLEDGSVAGVGWFTSNGDGDENNRIYRSGVDAPEPVRAAMEMERDSCDLSGDFADVTFLEYKIINVSVLDKIDEALSRQR